MLFDAGNIAIPAGELDRAQNWRSRGARPLRLNGFKGEGQIHSVRSAGIYELTISPAVKQRSQARRWRKAGYLIRRSKGSHCGDAWLPLGKSLVFVEADNGSPTLWLKPVPWLIEPRVSVREYIGDWEYRDSVSVAISAQLETLPAQIAQTIEVLLDAGETP